MRLVRRVESGKTAYGHLHASQRAFSAIKGEQKMTFFKAAPALLSLAILGTALSPSLKADDYDHMTTITFSAPVEIPPVYITGMRVLPAGTYVFKLVNSSNDRHIVQIFNKDQSKIYATILAIANYRLKPTGKTVITFNEGIRGKPEALRAWFFPGANWGEEFVYPKDKAVELAQVVKQPVLAVVADVKIEVEKPEAPEVVAQLQQLPIRAVQPTGEVVEVAQVAQVVPPQVVAATPEPVLIAQNTLPATSSALPLIGLCGLLALGGGFILQSISKKV
jgi:hypothetical protein